MGRPGRGRLYTYSLGFLCQRRVRRILTLVGWDLRLGWPGSDDAVAVWGQRPVAARGRAVARRTGAGLITVEDGFLRSLRPGVTGAPPLSLIIDDLGIYHDASRASRLERILSEIDLDTSRTTEAEATLVRLREARLSKYTPPVPRRDFGSGHVVVVDQTRGDSSIQGGGAGQETFRRMLDAARVENPGARLIIKSHPDVVAGAKQGHLSPSDLSGSEEILADDVNPWDVVAGAAVVYTVSSQLGYEAVLAGCRVRCFGHGFYAGWGLTEDESRHPRRTRALTVPELFAGCHLRYPVYYDPWRDRLCDIGTVIEALEYERAAETPASDAIGEVFANVRLWKRRSLMRFRPALPRPPRFSDTWQQAVDIARAEDRDAWFWASKVPLAAALRGDGPPIRAGFVEDGFLRSIGLGAALIEPASLVFDRQGIYFDPHAPSDLEGLIAEAAAGRGDPGRAARLRGRIVAAGLTKYDVGRRPSVERPGAKTMIVVPGQVEDDTSILRGCADVRTNVALLERAREANPDAWIVYKPHPDVEAGLRTGSIEPAVAAALADEVAMNASAADLIDAADAVWTMTSLMGFEALMRGKAVTCLGTPFYAGWGLTTDLGPRVPRRTARPTLDQLVWAALIAYPCYRDPVTGLPCGPELIVERFASGATTRQSGVLSRLQSTLAGAPSPPIARPAEKSTNSSTRSAASSDAAMWPPPSHISRVIPRSASAASAAFISSHSLRIGTLIVSMPRSVSASWRSAGAVPRCRIQVGISRAVAASRPVSGSDRLASATIRTGARSPRPRSRTSSIGSSARAVPEPIRIASVLARIRWTRRRASGPVIHRLSPVRVAIRPSSVAASLSRTCGRPRSIRQRKPRLTARASSASRPVSTVIPASRSAANPRPETRGSGSVIGQTSLVMPASISAPVQGGVRPWWAHGSSVT